MLGRRATRKALRANAGYSTRQWFQPDVAITHVGAGTLVVVILQQDRARLAEFLVHLARCVLVELSVLNQRDAVELDRDAAFLDDLSLGIDAR